MECQFMVFADRFFSRQHKSQVLSKFHHKRSCMFLWVEIVHPFHPDTLSWSSLEQSLGMKLRDVLLWRSLKREIRIYRKCSFHQQEGSSCFSHGGFLSPTAAYLKNQPSLRGYFEGQKLHGPERGGGTYMWYVNSPMDFWKRNGR